MKNLTQPGGQVRTFLQADRGRCASVKGLQYLYIYAMIWTQVPSRSLASEAKRLTQPGGLVRLRRLTDQNGGRQALVFSFWLVDRIESSYWVEEPLGSRGRGAVSH